MGPRSIRAARQSAPIRRATPLLERVRSGGLSLAVQHENLDEKIYATLRKLILERQFQPGERILVDLLAAEMGVSRTPILNALRRLGQEGVVQVFARRGIYVRRYEKAEMVRLFTVREVLDGLAARLATAHIRSAEIDEFVRAFRRHNTTSPTPAAIRRYVELDRAFHCRLMELVDNDQLRAAMDSINMRLFVWQDGVVRPPSETVPEHLAILDALRRRDAEGSEAAMRLHIRRSLEQLQREADSEAMDGGTRGAPPRLGRSGARA
jgi:GntR family transcriptional regulator, rspAB operon transcriptional repressor